MTLPVPRLPFSLDPLIAEAKRRMRRRRLILAALVLLGAGAVTGIVLLTRPPGSSSTPPAAAPPAKTPARNAAPPLGKVLATRCTAVSGGFRACTVFHFGGEVSRIERRHGTRWSVALAPTRAPHPGSPYAHVGHWRRVLAGPRGQILLAQWSGECEVQFAYMITTRNPVLHQVFGLHPVSVLGWTSDGLARVKLLEPVYARGTRIRFPSGIYVVTPGGHAVRLERRIAPALGC
jgi:hypothetical protein